MPGVLYQYLSDDHDKLDALLQRAAATPGVIDMEPYSEFRRRLLRHISMEEKIVLPAIARLQGGRKAEIAARLRRDHSAIVSLLVPSPNPSIIRTLHSIFEKHNPVEEDEGGLYDMLETLAGSASETGRLLEQLTAAPPVPVLPNNDQAELLELAKQAVSRAGYEFKKEE